jgi:hypothetical protein
MTINCQVHFGEIPLEQRHGSLIDQNGHTWLVCGECIDKLWQTARPPITELDANSPYPTPAPNGDGWERATQLVKERETAMMGLATLTGSVIAWQNEFTRAYEAGKSEYLIYVTRGIMAAMNTAIREAQKIYRSEVAAEVTDNA